MTTTPLEAGTPTVPVERASAARPTVRPAHSKFNWALFWAHVKYWTWVGITKTFVTVVYLALISQGLRYVLPDIGLRLYKLPGLAFLKNYTATFRLDLAHVFAAIPLMSTWILWHLNLELYLLPHRFQERFRGWNLDRIKRLIVTMGVIIVVGDALLFCAAFTLAQWGGGKFSASAVIATAIYVTVLGFVSFVAMCLQETIDTHQRKDK